MYSTLNSQLIQKIGQKIRLEYFIAKLIYSTTQKNKIELFLIVLKPAPKLLKINTDLPNTQNAEGSPHQYI